MSVPTARGGQFYSNASSGSYWDGDLLNSSTADAVKIAVLKPANPELKLTYSTLAYYFTFAAWPGNYGWLAFGLPTPPGAVPVSGSATYSAIVQGSPGWDGVVSGSATLDFNFGAGTLSGHFDPQVTSNDGTDSPVSGRYDFASTIFGVGSTSFSGAISNSDFSQKGSFRGSFTGPGAEELISTWTAPFHSPFGGQDTMGFGVWAGKKP
jgi:hypothetical protein